MKKIFLKKIFLDMENKILYKNIQTIVRLNLLGVRKENEKKRI